LLASDSSTSRLIEPNHTTLGLLTAALPVPGSARLGAGAGLLGDSVAAGQLGLLATIMISGLLTTSISPSP
jgi:hypothetical protein